ncbi:MAG: HypC/HybG/HupF family hydrogenase formation chaperone [Chloroflexota bacterium]|nr:HypC/HybG/HupF family hydrogenase formation chaperone [Chloroflexota bacterium]
MSNEQRPSIELTEFGTSNNSASCELNAEGHCITCSDEALEARVLRVDQQSGVAFVTISDVLEEVDISLVDAVGAGDMLLVHGGVAISRVGEAHDA